MIAGRCQGMFGLALAGALVAVPCLRAGPAGEELQFDAASVKPASPNLPGGRLGAVAPVGGPGTADPGRISYRATSLKSLLMGAYAVENFQIEGPGWMDTELFELSATMSPGTTEEQFRAMLRNLLRERFQLQTHRETKEFSGYALVIAKNGPKLKEAREALAASRGGDATARPQLGADGYFVPPQRPGLFLQLTGAGGVRSTFQRVSMEELAATLQSQLQRPVSDATGLKSNYDFVLNYAREGLYFGRLRIPVSPGDPETQPGLLAALPDQVGLRLEPKKTMAEVIVIDQAAKMVQAN